MKKSLSRVVVIVALPLLLAACANKPSAIKSEADYYQEANEALKAGNFNVAVNAFEALEAQYPVGVFTEQAQLEVIYGKYKQADYLAAIAAADRYIRLHPTSDRIDYVLYLRGLANYNIDQDTLLKRMPINLAHRDMGQAKVAFDDFGQLLTRYPASPYAPDARQRMIYLRNQLAEAELHVARYYETRGANVAALNRARWVVENYSESTAVPEALKLMIKHYQALGMNDLADQAKALLPKTKPKS
ncbi:MAG: outer membrane protein assembly factor BamD [Moraxellaceae bacterium]|nr:outer membrane protein assembly factor BamD [Moraxellaceae bacterium]MDP1775018.1 outer membrane protein assembly factor BamD [Moraxellaceae bacterium]